MEFVIGTELDFQNQVRANHTRGTRGEVRTIRRFTRILTTPAGLIEVSLNFFFFFLNCIGNGTACSDFIVITIPSYKRKAVLKQ